MVLLIAAAITQTSRWISGIDEESSPVSISLFLRVLVVLGLAYLAYKLAAGDAAEEFFNGRSIEVAEAVPEDLRAPAKLEAAVLINVAIISHIVEAAAAIPEAPSLANHLAVSSRMQYDAHHVKAFDNTSNVPTQGSNPRENR